MTVDDYILFFFNMDVNLSSKVASLLWMKAKRTAVVKGHMLQQGIHHTNNYEMLNYVLDDWMPWHRENYDFSTIDINR